MIVVSETYKFCEKVQLDSIVYNELGSPSELVKEVESSIEEESSDNGNNNNNNNNNSSKKKNTDNDTTKATKFTAEKNTRYKGAAGVLCPQDPLPFQVVNLRYDLTPIENISAVATEHGLIPPTSIPVLVEELRAEE